MCVIGVSSSVQLQTDSIMTEATDITLSKELEALWDKVSEAHQGIQRDFTEIDPMVGLSQNMRKHGIPADVITIDCLRSRKRIIIILHEQQPDIISYQFALMDKDPEGEFETLATAELSVQILYQWIQGYFQQQ